MKKKLIAIISAAMATTVIFTACGSKSSTGSKNNAQVLKVRGYDIQSLDLTLGNDMQTASTVKNVFEGLYRDIEENGVQKSVPAVAEKMDKNAEGTVYTFHLRKDAKWSDGKPVTADQFVYSWKRLLDPKVASPYADFIDMVKGAKEYRTGADKTGDGVGLKAVDDYTFEVTLKEPTAYFEKILSFTNLAPLRKDNVEAAGDQFGSDFKQVVYNGPFVVADYQKGSKVVLKKNDQYWDKDNVKLNEVDGTIYDDTNVGVKMFENNELDIVEGAGDDLKKLDEEAKAGKFDKVSGFSPRTTYVIYNVQNAALKNAKVRQAISVALDRKEYVDVVHKRYAPATGIISKAITLNGKEYRDQVEEQLNTLVSSTKDAKSLFEDGMKEAGVDVSTPIKLLYPPKTAKTQVDGEYIQKALKEKLGLNVELDFAVDNPSYYAARTGSKFEMTVGGWTADYDDASSFMDMFATGGGNNSGKYSDAKYDELVNKARAEQDQAKRIDLYKQAEKIATVEDPAVAPLYYQDNNMFVHKNVKGFYVPHFNGYYDFKPISKEGK